MSKELIQSFYSAFAKHDGEAMANMYHDDAKFSDPVFQNLNRKEVGAMWQMLIERSKGELQIDFHSISQKGTSWEVVWEAKYHFSKTKRPVHNVITATIEFKDGKIWKHTDHFSFWRWSRMALGLPGILIGWTSFLKSKVRNQAMDGLRKYNTEM